MTPILYMLAGVACLLVASTDGRKVGGIWFFRLGRLRFSCCVARVIR